MTGQETETVLLQFGDNCEDKIRVKQDIPDYVKLIYIVLLVAFIASSFLWI